jgi:hypothetical protein
MKCNANAVTRQLPCQHGRLRWHQCGHLQIQQMAGPTPLVWTQGMRITNAQIEIGCAKDHSNNTRPEKVSSLFFDSCPSWSMRSGKSQQKKPGRSFLISGAQPVYANLAQEFVLRCLYAMAPTAGVCVKLAVDRKACLTFKRN